MTDNSPKFYLTTPIYYVNARPHIGHAYSTIVADVIARRHRLAGEDVFFLTGTDEHGQKIERSAAAAGIPPQEFADGVSATFRALWHRMGITNDDYIRTTEGRHKRGVQKLFAALKERGAIYLDTYTGQYCVSDEAYVDGPPGVVCPDCGNVTETVSEQNYYFRLSQYGTELAAKIESGELNIQPESRRNEVLSFVRGGLKDISVSRTSVSWGVPVPGDERHVIYVWFDALVNYLTGIGYGSDDPDAQAKLARYWPANLHLVGKEIIRFHCVYWPAFLLAAGLPLPKEIVANGWLLFEESKMSKSRGNVVRTETILDSFGALKPELPKTEQDLFGADVLRYFLLREIPFGQDGSFSFDALVTRYNADLANGYGNLVSRTLAMITKYFDGVVPTSAVAKQEHSQIAVPANTSISMVVADAIRRFETEISRLALNSGLEIWASLVGAMDGFITASAPWKLAADGTKQIELAEVLYTAAEAIRIITALLYPVMPYATAQVWKQLGLGDIEAAAKNGELKDLQWDGLVAGTQLGTLGPIFPRADKGLVQTMMDAEANNATPKSVLNHEGESAGSESVVATDPAAGPRTGTIPVKDPAAQVAGSHATTTERAGTPSHTEAQSSGIFANAAAASAIPDTPQIAIDDFVKIDLRVAEIVVAERIPKADKLLRLEVDLGYERRQILSGIAEWYTPEELIGRRIVVIANLAPRKMRGLESHGMLLAASHGENGKPVLATFGEEIALGSRLR